MWQLILGGGICDISHLLVSGIIASQEGEGNRNFPVGAVGADSWITHETKIVGMVVLYTTNQQREIWNKRWNLEIWNNTKSGMKSGIWNIAKSGIMRNLE